MSSGRPQPGGPPPEQGIQCIAEDLDLEADPILIDQAIDALTQWMVLEYLARHPELRKG